MPLFHRGAVDRLADLPLARGAHGVFLLVVVQHLRPPVEPQELQHLPGDELGIVDQLLVVDFQHGQRLHRAPVLHQARVIGVVVRQPLKPH